MRIVADARIGQRHQIVDIKLVGRHRHRAIAPFPQRRIAIGIDLDAVAFGIVEIDGFADEMIGKARQRHAMDCRIDQPARQILARRHQERRVIKPGRGAGFARCVWVRFEHQEPDAAGAEHRTRGRALHHGKPEHVAVVIRHRHRAGAPGSSPCRSASASGWRRSARRLPRPPGTRRAGGRGREGGSAGKMQQRASGHVWVHRGLMAWCYGLSSAVYQTFDRLPRVTAQFRSHVRRSRKGLGSSSA